MRKALLILVLTAMAVGSAHAALDSIPDYTIFLTDVSSVYVVDSFAIGVTSEGLASFEFNDSTSKFEYVEQLYLPITDISFRRHKDLLYMQSGDSKLWIFEIDSLPFLRIRGSIDFDRPFADFAVRGDQLYLAAWYDGVWRYQMESYSSAHFVDSSMKGILVTGVDNFDDTLYAIDEYNGVLRYDLAGGGFGTFMDYLYIPFRTGWIMRHDSLFVVLLKTGGMYLAEFNESGGEIIDSVTDIPEIVTAFVADSTVALLSERSMYLYDYPELALRAGVNLTENIPDGDAFYIGGKPFALLPDLDGGLSLIDLDGDPTPIPASQRSGRVTGLLIFNDKLFLGGDATPIEVYDIADTGSVTYAYTIYDALDNISAMEHTNDTLMVLYPEFSKVAIIVHSGDPDSVLLESSFFVNAGSVRDMKYFPFRVHDHRLLLLRKLDKLDVYTVSDSAILNYSGEWDFIGDIQEFAVKDTFLFVATSKKSVNVYSIDADYNLHFIQDIGFSSTIIGSYLLNDKLFMFQTDRLFVIDVSNPAASHIDTVMYVPMPIVDASYYNGRLYGVGSGGVSVFEIDQQGLPVLAETGGIDGEVLIAGSGILAVSDGFGVHIFVLEPDGIVTDIGNDEEVPDRFALEQNYPNPFNLETTIGFNLPRRVKVTLSVFNILGQTVVTLVDSELEAGPHEIVWDGKSESGDVVGTGIYLYRLVAGDERQSKKMLLLK